jgi:hypothetical protein
VYLSCAVAFNGRFDRSCRWVSPYGSVLVLVLPLVLDSSARTKDDDEDE